MNLTREVATKTARRTAAVGAAGLVALVASLHGSPVSAQTIDVPIGDAYLNGAPGSVTTIGTGSVPADLVGRSCNLAVAVVNQGSVHPGNSVIVSSGTSQVTVASVEEVADITVKGAGVLTLGSTIEVKLQLGNDGLSSLGSNVSVTCEPLPVAPPPTPIPKQPKYTG
jgi:hypothetical protein